MTPKPHRPDRRAEPPRRCNDTSWAAPGHRDGRDDLSLYDGGFTLLAQEGSASPVSGRNWLSLSGPEMDLNNHTEYVFSGSLDGDAATDLLILIANWGDCP